MTSEDLKVFKILFQLSWRLFTQNILMYISPLLYVLHFFLLIINKLNKTVYLEVSQPF